MAISFSLVDSGFDTGTSPYTIPSLTLTANKVAVCDLLCFDAGSLAAAPATFTDSLGNTWTKEAETLSATNALVRYVAPITVGGTSTITLTFSVQHEGLMWIIAQSADVDAADPTVQTVTDSIVSGTSRTTTLAAFGSANNAAYGVIAKNLNEVTTVGSGFTELADETAELQPSAAPRAIQAQWKLNDTTCDWSWATSTGARMIVTEFRAGSSSTGQIALPTISGTTVSTLSVAAATATVPHFAIAPVCGGGACNGGAVSPYNNQRVVSWGDLGGPWYSSDGGENWDRCAGGLNDQSPDHTGGDVEWSKDSNFPNRVWALTSGGFFVSNSWPPTWSKVSSAVQGGEHGNRPRQVGGMVHDTGNGIVYVCSPTAIRRYDVPAGATGENSNGFTVIANSGFAGANAVCADPQDDGTVWFATSTGVRQIDNADTRSTQASSAVAGLTGQTWDLSAVSLSSTTYVYVASDTNKVRRLTPSTGAVAAITTGLPGGKYCAIEAVVVSGAVHVVVGIDSSVASGGNYQQYFRSTNASAATANVSWTCLSLDNADMAIVETEGPTGEDWVGYLAAVDGGQFGNRLRDENTHTPHDMSYSADGRYLYSFTTGGCYRFDFNLNRAYPMMHNLGTTTFGAIRTHPTVADKNIVMNTDHWGFVTDDGGASYRKAERGAPQGVMQGSAACFDPGSTTRAFSSGGDRGKNTGGVVMMNPDPFSFDSWTTLAWPHNQQVIGMDARRIGSRIYIFCAGLNAVNVGEVAGRSGMHRWDAATSNITNAGGTWTHCTGSAFSAGGSALFADVRWASDSLVYALDRNRGVYRCTNPTAATPNFDLIYAVTSDAERHGHMRVLDADTVMVSRGSPNGGTLVKLTGASSGSPGVVTMNKPAAAGFARPGVMDVYDGVVYATECKSDSGANAAIFRGPVGATAATNSLSENITDDWFGPNHAKQSDMAINADGTKLFTCGRGGGVWIGTLAGTPTPDSQSFDLPYFPSTMPAAPPISIGTWPQSFTQHQAIEAATGTAIPYFRGRQLDGQWDQSLIQSNARAAVNAGYSIGMNIQPKTGSGNNRTGVPYTDIIADLNAGSGQHYNKILSFINECKTLPAQGSRPYYMQFHSESAFQAAPGVLDAQPYVGTAADFKTCHDLIYQFFLDQGVTWLTWQVVQNHGVYGGSNGGTAAWIPARYDYVGVDDYHGLSNGRYETPTQMFGVALAFAQAAGKPLWIDETGSNEGGSGGADATDKATWFQQLDTWLAANQDDIAGIVFSHAQDGGAWYLDSVMPPTPVTRATPNFSGTSWNAWRTMARSTKFQPTVAAQGTRVYPLGVALGSGPPAIQAAALPHVNTAQVLPLDVGFAAAQTLALENIASPGAYDLTVANLTPNIAGRGIGRFYRHQRGIATWTRS